MKIPANALPRLCEHMPATAVDSLRPARSSADGAKVDGIRPQPPATKLPDLPPPAPAQTLSARVGRSLRRGAVAMQFATFERLLSRRLTHTYGPRSGWPQDELQRATRELVRQLDFHANGVTFRDELRELTRTPAVVRYLEALETALLEAHDGRPLRLFELTLAHAGSPDEAMRWLGVLLQDVRQRTATDDFFEGEVPAALEPRFRSLMALLQTPAVMAHVAPYPSDEVFHNRAFYHYYVPAHLARRLVAAGVPAELAAFTATTFNAEYELNQHVARVGGSRWDFVRHGATDGYGMHPRSVEQIQMGYHASMRGAGLIPDCSALTALALERPIDALSKLMRDSYLRSAAR